MLWLTADAQQETYLLEGSNLPTRKAVYSDADVLASDKAFVADFYDAFVDALPRPVHPDYPAMSAVVWEPLHDALAGTKSAAVAAADLNTAVQAVLDESTFTKDDDAPIPFWIYFLSISVLAAIYRKNKN